MRAIAKDPLVNRLHLVAITTFFLYSSDESFKSFPMILSDSPYP